MSRNAVTLAVCLFASLTIPRVSCLPSNDDHAGLQRVLIRINDVNYNCTHFRQQLEGLISATSEHLFATTRNRTSWKSVWVALPSGWSKDDNCFLPDVVPAAPSWYRYGSADIIIDQSHPLLGDAPWAQQYGGCRVPGRQIRLSSNYVLNSLNQEGKLAKEWIKYRYGVFEESGFDNDYQYPLTYKDSMITLSNNQSDFTPWTCDDYNNDDDNNNNTTGQGDLCAKQVIRLSHADNHRRMAPTKQNLLCRELSYWQVLEQHADFQSTSIDEESTATDLPTTDTPAGSDTQYEEPTIHYFLPNSPRYVLLLDRSNHMANASRWTLLRRALYRWVHSLPDDTLLSIVVAGREATQVLPWTRVSQENRDGLAGRIPRRPLTQDEEFCYACGIRLATQILNQSEDGSVRGGNLVVVSGTFGIPDDFESIRMELEALEIRVDSIVFPGQVSVVSDSRWSGLRLSVMEETAMHEAAVTQMRMTQALLQILREEQQDAPNQIYEKFHYARDGNSVLGSFPLDSRMGRNIWITAHSADEADLDTLEVVSPSGIVYDLPLIYDGLLYIRIAETSEFGDWSYRLRFSHPVKDYASSVIEVTAQPSRSSESSGDRPSSAETFSVRGWTSIGNTAVNASQTPIILYAEVVLGQTPVVDAKVVAVVRLPGAKSVEEEVVLHDRGTGDPDITRADGIYSAYFSHAVEQPGSYSVMLYVSDNSRRASLPLQNAHNSDVTCCGSSMPYTDSAPSGPFQRIVVVPSFSTSAGPAKGQDIYPPSRITDLRIERVFNSSNEVELSWTAPGGDYDSGIASFYEIRCYTDRSALNDSSSAILVHSSLTPPPSLAGSPQHAVVAVPWPNQQFYYAMVAVDEHQNRGDVSNIVAVYIYEPPPPTTPPPANETDPADTSSLFGAARSNIDTHRATNDTQMYAIAGGVAGFVVLLLILSVAAFCSRRKGVSSKEKKAQEAKNNIKIQVEPLNVEKLPPKEEVLNLENIPEKDRPVYQIFVNNAYIQEEDGEVKIITPDGQVIQRGSSSWYSTLPRGRSITNLNETSFTDGLHWSLPRSKASPHRHKVLTNGSIMQTTAGGSQNTLGIPVADGTSISSKPSVSSEDTGIELNDPGIHIEADSRDSADAAVIPPPDFGPYPGPHHNGYMPMFGNYVPNVHAQNARVVRVASSCNSPDSCGLSEVYMQQPSSRRPIVGSVASSSNEDGYTMNGSVQGDYPQTPRKKRHISFV